jgi:hypothetical protein
VFQYFHNLSLWCRWCELLVQLCCDAWLLLIISPFCFLFVLLSSSSPTDYRIRFVVVIFGIHDNYRSTLSTHHCLRVDPSTDLGLQGPVLQAVATTTSARPHANLISPFSSLCSRYVVVHTFCREARVINLCSGCFCFAVWQVWWHCREIKDPGPISIRLSEGWNLYLLPNLALTWIVIGTCQICYTSVL